MPGTPVADGEVYIVRVACLCGGQLGMNDYRYIISDLVASSGSTVENMTTYLDTLISALYKNWLASDATYYGISVNRLQPSALQPITVVDPFTGTNGTKTSPKQSSSLVTKKTATPGKTGRGRVYIPFVSQTSTTVNGELNVVGFGFLDAISAFMFTPIPITFPGPGSCNLNPVLCKSTVDIPKPIVSWQSRRTIATQRRRGDYGKLNNPPW